jgi:hypothetical protein
LRRNAKALPRLTVRQTLGGQKRRFSLRKRCSSQATVIIDDNAASKRIAEGPQPLGLSIFTDCSRTVGIADVTRRNRERCRKEYEVLGCRSEWCLKCGCHWVVQLQVPDSRPPAQEVRGVEDAAGGPMGRGKEDDRESRSETSSQTKGEAGRSLTFAPPPPGWVLGRGVRAALVCPHTDVAPAHIPSLSLSDS